MKCPKCKNEVSPQWKRCPYCEYVPRVCSKPECTSGWLPTEAHFCPLCGSPVKGEEHLIVREILQKAIAGISHSCNTGYSDNTECDNELIFSVGGVTFKMIKVEGGTFMMGAQSDDANADNYDPDADEDESPVHKVTLCDYHIGETPVTQELWEAVMDGNPSKFEGSDNPVDRVSWDDCREFIRKLNRKLRDQLPQGCKFQLPTEAQWEFAARGGNDSLDYTYSGGDDIDDVAWYDGNSNAETHPVMEKQANKLGLYDMSGNVCEWCQDWYDEYVEENQYNPEGPSSGSFRVLRGGSWDYGAEGCSVSTRNYFSPASRSSDVGFRLALVQQ